MLSQPKLKVTARAPEDEIRSKYQRTFFELIPPEGVCHKTHRKKFDKNHCGQTSNLSKEYTNATKALLKRRLIMDQNGEFCRYVNEEDCTDNQITNNLCI